MSLRARIIIRDPFSDSNPQVRYLSLKRQVASTGEADKVLRQLQDLGWGVFRPGKRRATKVARGCVPRTKCCASCGCSKEKPDFSLQNWSQAVPNCRVCSSSRQAEQHEAAIKRRQQALATFVPPLPRPQVEKAMDTLHWRLNQAEILATERPEGEQAQVGSGSDCSSDDRQVSILSSDDEGWSDADNPWAKMVHHQTGIRNNPSGQWRASADDY